MYKLINEHGEEYLSEIPGTLGGNKRLGIYGKLDCSSANRWIKKGYYVKDRVFFLDEETVIKAGYRPCAICMKNEYDKWKREQRIIEIDNEIKSCDECSGMVEKFDTGSTVSVGNKSDIVILGEAPANNGWRKSGVAWYDENHNLIPSGIVLQRLLKLIDYALEDTCFLEAVKCYPKERKFLKECSSNCKKYLIEQLLALKPQIVLPLGDVATRSVIDTKYHKFGDVVGKCFNVNGCDVIPIYHPSPISPLSYNGNVDIFEGIIKEKVRVLKEN